MAAQLPLFYSPLLPASSAGTRRRATLCRLTEIGPAFALSPNKFTVLLRLN